MVYFILPIYNERGNVHSLISGIRKKMQGREHVIIAVNDGSTDGTLGQLQALNGQNLVIISSLINMNVGAVFSAGIARVLETANDDDAVIIMESDQTSDFGLIDGLLDQIQNNGMDIVIASRFIPGGGYVGFPWSRRVLSFGANYLMRFYFPIIKVIDYSIFFRAYRKGILKRAVEVFGPFGLIQSRGFSANAELLIKLSLLTDRIKEIPFVYNYARKRGQSKIRIFNTINEYFTLISYLKIIMRKYRFLSG